MATQRGISRLLLATSNNLLKSTTATPCRIGPAPALFDSISPIRINLCLGLHTLRISKNVSLLSEHKFTKTKDLQILDSNSRERPLILFFSWLNATEKNSMKYVNIYSDRGYDVLKVAIFPKDLWRPEASMQVVARQVVEVLEKNEKFKQIMIHGMSVGAYAFCEIMNEMLSDTKRYRSTMDRFVGQIWDSPVDVHGAPVGTSKAVTDNQYIQKFIQAVFQKVLENRYDDITVFYNRASVSFHRNDINVPSLYLVSKVDLVSDLPTNLAIIDKWRAKGSNVRLCCFEKSPHVMHYQQHKIEYERESLKFLRDVVSLAPVPVEVPEESLDKSTTLPLQLA